MRCRRTHILSRGVTGRDFGGLRLRSGGCARVQLQAISYQIKLQAPGGLSVYHVVYITVGPHRPFTHYSMQNRPSLSQFENGITQRKT